MTVEEGLKINLLKDNTEDNSPCRFFPCILGSVFLGVLTMLAIQYIV